MGWLSMMSMGGHPTPKAYLDAQFTWAREAHVSRVLKSSVVGRVYYAAVERTGPDVDQRQVYAAVCLFRYTPKARDGYIFAYKDMDETVGPNERKCPAGILELLTPTTYEYALGWRADCRANLAKAAQRGRKPRPKAGDVVVLAEPLKFQDGASLTRFRATRRAFRRNLVFQSLENGRLYRFALAVRDYQLNPIEGEEGRDEQASQISETEPDMPDTPISPVVATLLTEEARPDFLPRLFDHWYLRGEMTVYAFMDELAENYGGGFWDFHDLSNGGGFLSPKRSEPVNMSCWGNGFGGTVSSEAAGIIVTLFAFSHLSFSPGAPEVLTENFSRLHAYACAHAESELILRAID